ncbi:hypothetical protein FBU30_010005 [Linnemannia zychae]|nr:hypothetical protein FBU30_010005 [Linnemannia zychae]
MHYFNEYQDASPPVVKNAGAYKPNHRPPPIPIDTALSNTSFTASPLSPGNTSSGGLLSPLRSASSASPRPSLPFLEKYAKLSKGSSPPAPLPQPNSDRQDQSYKATPQHQQQPMTPSHHQREQSEYFLTKSPTEDRFAFAAALAATTASQQQQYQDNQPIIRSYEKARSKTPTAAMEARASSFVYSSSNGTKISQYAQPALPQKSTARVPSIASVHSLAGHGHAGYDFNGRSKSSQGNINGHSPYTVNRDNDHERLRERGNRSAPIPENVSQYNHQFPAPNAPVPVRSGSDASAASSIAERRANRERSNTMQSERSDTSRSRYQEVSNIANDRYGRSERENEKVRPLTPSSSRSGAGGRRFQESISAYKTPSPPASSKDDEDGRLAGANTSKGPAYRPLTPPEIASPIPTRGARPSMTQPSGRKPTGGVDQFDALMDDLLQQIDFLPTSSSPSSRASTNSSTRASARDSTRDTTRDSSRYSRSRSRSLVSESGRVPLDNNTVVPPTPRLPGISLNTSVGSESPSIASASARSQQRRLERETSGRSERSERDQANSPRLRREGSDISREYERDRERERERQRDREKTHDRESTRSSSSTALSSRSRSAHPPSSSRHDRAGTGSHPCQGCHYDIRPSEADRCIKMNRIGDFHPECFKCTRCRKPLESSRYAFEFEGLPYCEKDQVRMVEREREKEKLRIQRRRLPTCAGCNDSIRSSETTVYALGQTWHDRHLQCYHCRKPILQPTSGGSGHVEKNGRIYCATDFADLFLPKCRKCNKSVEKEAVSAQDGKLKGKWHTACFGCHTCHRPFPDKSFYVFDDEPYCRRHYHKMNRSLCKSCDEPIEGPCAQTVEGWRYHPNCFSCAECRIPLTDIYYNFENKSYCERDIAIIQRTRNVRAERRRTFFGKV